MRACVSALALLILAGCGGGPNVKLYKVEDFKTGTAAFSRTLPLASNVVCRNVRRALISQGYVIEQTPASKESPFLQGSKSWQPEDDVSITLKVQATCVHEGDNSSTVFITAIEEAHKLQTVMNSVSAGVSVATVTLPSTSGRALMPVRRETIQDPKFYASFYDLVYKFAKQEHDSTPPPLAEDQTQGTSETTVRRQ